MNPMQINTKNPDGSGKRGGPLPRASMAPSGANYSGLLECPCTTRVKKVIEEGYETQFGGQCDAVTAAECFQAVATMLGPQIKNYSVSDASTTPGCLIDQKAGQMAAVFNSAVSKVACPSAPALTKAHLAELVTMDVTVNSSETTLTLSGPSQDWFGVGFDARQMDDLPYAIIVNGSGGIEERRIGDHNPGSSLMPSVTLVSSSVVGNTRTVVLTRPSKGITKDHYSFSTATASVPVITAIGNTPNLQYHKARASARLNFVGVTNPTCVCPFSIKTINGIPYDPQCYPYPLSDLLPTHNPTCDISTCTYSVAL